MGRGPLTLRFLASSSSTSPSAEYGLPFTLTTSATTDALRPSPDPRSALGARAPLSPAVLVPPSPAALGPPSPAPPAPGPPCPAQTSQGPQVPPAPSVRAWSALSVAPRVPGAKRSDAS